MFKIDIYNHDITDNSVFTPWYYNFINHCRLVTNYKLSFDDVKFLDILKENDITIINYEFWTDCKETAVAFILRWS